MRFPAYSPDAHLLLRALWLLNFFIVIIIPRKERFCNGGGSDFGEIGGELGYPAGSGLADEKKFAVFVFGDFDKAVVIVEKMGLVTVWQKP